MRARLFLLLILLLGTSSFFWEDEQKLLRQLNQAGESALLKADFEAAKKAFEELHGRISVVPSQKYQVDWHTYADVTMRLAHIYAQLNEKESAKKVLQSALASHPPIELACQLKLIKARLSATDEAPAEAYFEMKQIALHLPLEKWPAKEISFYHALEQTLDIHYDTLLRKAKLLMTAGMYLEAATAYGEIFTAIERDCYPRVRSPQSLVAKQVRYKLAECHYLNANYEQSLSYLQPGHDSEMIYLSALCYREKREYEKALELFEQYAHLASQSDLEHYDHALFEIGHYFYQANQNTKAKDYFEKLQALTGKPSQLARIFLARIHLDEEKASEVEKILKPLVDQLSTQDSLQYECYYLRGLAAYKLGTFHEARDYFERSLPYKQVGKWSCHSLYHLGWCSVHLGEALSKSDEARQRFFNKAEESFVALLTTHMHEEAWLSLAELYILEESPGKLEKLMLEASETFSVNGQLEALLLRAKACSDYTDKEHLYALATANHFRRSPLYAQAWYSKGINYFEKGLHESLHANHFFEMAIGAFEKAFRVADGEQTLAADSVKMEAKTHLLRASPVQSLALLEKLLLHFEESTKQREETLYLRGLLAARTPSASNFLIAEASLSELITHHPQSTYKPGALFALGTLYYNNQQFAQAGELFCRLATEHAQSSYAPDGWFWAAEAASSCGHPSVMLRRHVYEDYPLSPLAATAYFRQYPYARYLEGGAEVVQHLKDFCSKFSESPLEVVVYYLIGLHEEKWESAQVAFEKSINAFSHYHAHSQTPDSYVYFYYRAKLELAHLYFSQSLETSETILCSLLADFEQEKHPLTAPLKESSLYPPLFEEGEYTLVQCYLKQGKEGNAQKKLQEMLRRYQTAGIQKGYYLSQVWQELGRLSMVHRDFDTALKCFDIALGCISETAIDEKQLIIWLEQSTCWREKKEYDVAMRLLSKVINAETVSPLRLKAMYLRSEIYELEDRPELAIRQLEAMTKKGGEWASQAKDKLKRIYDVE